MERIALYEEKRFKQMSEKIMKFYTFYLLFVLTKNKKEYILYS